MTHRLRRPPATTQQDRRSYCATSEMQEFPEDFVSAVEYNTRNRWANTNDNRVQSEEV
jgi:hypothetical protein